MSTRILVYADWAGLGAPQHLGVLHAHSGGAREVFEFSYDPAALAHPVLCQVQIDPRLGLYGGHQHPPQGHTVFGAFADASPDRWGRLLMRRRLERAQRAGTAPKDARLREADYLLGVHDVFRCGALRLKREENGPFLDDQHGYAAPPMVALRELEAAALALERDEDNTASEGAQWLRLLIAPGGSLGGARPKASVLDPDGQLWIAKFPSLRDEHDTGAWELLTQTLAQACGLRVPRALARRFGSPHHTYLVQRFDRLGAQRLHFASAMTLTGHRDGEDASTGASYLELAQVLMAHGAQPQADLRELWTRIVFNMLVSNTDDHLRNHGFLLEPGKGWRLSPAYDMNPVAGAQGLKLNVSASDNALDLGLAQSVAPYFRVSTAQARQILEHCCQVVQQWRTVAQGLGLGAREQERMAPAFALAQR